MFSSQREKAKHPQEKLTILCRFTRKFMLSSWRKALAYWSYGKEGGKKKKKEWWIKNYLPTNFHLPLKPHVSGAELPVSSCNAENTLKTSSYSQACFQSHKGKIFLIWIPRHSLHYLLFSSRSIFCFISLLIKTVDCTCCSIKILTSAI